MDFDNIYEEYFDRVYYKVLSVVKNDDRRIQKNEFPC